MTFSALKSKVPRNGVRDPVFTLLPRARNVRSTGLGLEFVKSADFAF
jgi:hypothetical protein